MVEVDVWMGSDIGSFTSLFHFSLTGVGFTPTTILKLLGSPFGTALVMTRDDSGPSMTVTSFGSALWTTAKRPSVIKERSLGPSHKSTTHKDKRQPQRKMTVR